MTQDNEREYYKFSEIGYNGWHLVTVASGLAHNVRVHIIGHSTMDATEITTTEHYMILKELGLGEEQKPADVEAVLAAVNAIAAGGGRQVVDIHEVGIDTVAFSVLYDFPESFVKASEVKKAGKGAVQSVDAGKSDRWREGEFGADYEITLKVPMEPSDAAKVKAALKKLQ